MTKGVAHALSTDEIDAIYQDIRAYAKEQNGVDYLQVYTDEQGRKLFFIDQLSKNMIESGEFWPEDNHCTLMFAHEY